MIVAVEGPSGAGKTTWCRRHARRFVGEYEPTGAEPADADPLSEAEFWVGVNRRRRLQAQQLEQAHGTAVCDTEPCKLHYSWCLSAIGAVSRSRWELELAAARRAFLDGALGFSDVVLVATPPVDVLRSHQCSDPSRRRRQFERHLRLREPLIAWYRAVDGLDPGRVIWDLPADGLPPRLPAPRRDCSDVGLLDALATSLPRS